MRPARCLLVGTILLLQGCGGDDTVARLQNGSAQQREEAAAFAGAQRIVAAIPALREALGDTSEGVRAKAVWALGMLRSKAALPDLVPLVASESRRIRQEAVKALAQIEEPEAIPALEKAMEVEKDVWIRMDLKASITYLRQFEGETEIGEGEFD